MQRRCVVEGTPSLFFNVGPKVNIMWIQIARMELQKKVAEQASKEGYKLAMYNIKDVQPPVPAPWNAAHP